MEPQLSGIGEELCSCIYQALNKTDNAMAACHKPQGLGGHQNGPYPGGGGAGRGGAGRGGEGHGGEGCEDEGHWVCGDCKWWTPTDRND
jgi:hypothetical protein